VKTPILARWEFHAADHNRWLADPDSRKRDCRREDYVHAVEQLPHFVLEHAPEALRF
jgi:hypothetical protein